MAKVSVILPVYNGAEYVEECLRSIRSQTLRDIEVIVVNDGSTDSTSQILCHHNRWARIVTHPSNLGASRSANDGIRVATGEYVSFIAHDDLWMTHKLESEVGFLEKWKADVAYSDFVQREHDHAERIVRLPEFDAGFMKSKECFINISSAIISRKALNYLMRTTGYWFDESLTSAMDWDLWIRLSKFCKFVHVPEPLSVYRRHKGQTSRKLSHRAQEIIVYTRYNGVSLRYTINLLLNEFIHRLNNLVGVCGY